MIVYVHQDNDIEVDYKVTKDIKFYLQSKRKRLFVVKIKAQVYPSSCWMSEIEFRKLLK